MRTVWCTIILRWRSQVLLSRTRRESHGAQSLGVGEFEFPFPEQREAYGACAEYEFLQSQKEMRAIWCRLILGWRNLSLALPEREGNPIAHTHAGLAKPRLCIPRKRGEPNDAHSLWVGETAALHCQNERRTI